MAKVVERRTVNYNGRVQGVGFRYTAQNTARRHPIAGYVRNLANGDVELVVEGSSPALDSFLADLANRLRDNIDGVRTEVAEATGEFDGFDVRF